MQIGQWLNKFLRQMWLNKKNKIIKTCKRIWAVAGVVLFLIGFGIIWTRLHVPTFQSVHDHYLPSDVWVVDQNGYPMESIRTRIENRSLDWVKWSDVSVSFQDLLIQTEDSRFYSHSGVDFLALAKAAIENIQGMLGSMQRHSRRGGSTITMQLVGLISENKFNVNNLNPNISNVKKSNQDKRGQRRTLWEKINQILLALKLNQQWSKEQILEAYVNLVSFRGELVGLRAASLGYLGKNPLGLDSQEAALLIALLRSPNAAAELVAKRACVILGDLDTKGLDSSNCLSVQNLALQIFSKSYRLNRSREMIPVLSKNFVIEGSKSSSLIQTSLDHRVQELAMGALQEQLRYLKKQNVNDGAVLVLESQTGRVVAYVANAGPGMASAEQIDGIQSRRQAGSTVKPFVYATAMDWQLLKPNSLLDDSPADITIGQGRVYHPKNYDQIFRGLVSVGDALGSSMNVPAVRALQLVGESRVLERLRALGFQQLQQDDYYGPSLALGSIDMTLWELTQGYRQFAVSESAFTEKTRLSIFNILASPEYRRFTFGMDSLLTLPFPAAVKTGTSKDMRDNWCIGWTADYTVGVWVGNFNGQPMWNVSGMSGAAPVWRRVMLALHPNPKGEITKYEAGSEPLPRPTISRIRYPAPQMLVGLDPDIPLELQKLPIEIENPQAGQKLFLNGKFLSRSQTTTLWSIQRGKYLVELKTTSGQAVDSVQFEVR